MKTSAAPRRGAPLGGAAMALCAALLWLGGCAAPRPPAAAAPAAKAPAPTAQATAATPAKPAAPAAPAVAGASAPAAMAAAAPAAPPPPPPIMPFDEAVMFAANAMFRNAPAGAEAGAMPLVIDPLIDGNSGVQSVATRTMERRIGDLVRSNYPHYDLQPFSTSTLARGPLLFIGTFTAVDKDGKNLGDREWYRVCLALLDLRTGKIVSKGFARSKPDGVDITPTQFFLDSPAWAPDQATEGYVKTCQGTKAGDPINPAYWDKIIAAAMVNDAMRAYDAGRYDEALDLYRGVSRLPAGDQLRVHNGIYLSAWKLGRQDEAAQAFSQIVDYGIAKKRLGLKILFRPGSTLFVTEQPVAAPYPLWLQQLATRAGQRQACMEISGHTSRTGPEPLNQRLSTARAQYVQQRLDADSPGIAKRTRAVGKGSQENIIGLGSDDNRDALDRRVEFQIVDCVMAGN